MPFSSTTKEKMSPFPRARALSSKENRESFEPGEASFRVYYGANGASIPFLWESQPGTPKHPIFDGNDDIVPPLTPPPSYSLRASSDDPSIKRKKYMVFRKLYSSITRKSRSHVTPTSSLTSSSPSSSLSLSSSSASSSSARSSPRKKCNKSHHNRSFSFCSPMESLSLFEREDEKGQNNVEFSSSSMCFGFKKQHGCYFMQVSSKRL